MLIPTTLRDDLVSASENIMKERLSESWILVKTDIDFTKHEPISTANSLHILEEVYEIDDTKYKVLHLIGNSSEPSVYQLTKLRITF